MSLIAEVFSNYRLRKRWLLKSAKGPVSEQSSAVNVLARRKCRGNLDSTTFTLISHLTEINRVRKSCSKSDLKSWDC